MAISEGRRLIENEFVLQQDNTPNHTVKKVTKYFKDKGINFMKWPPQSTNLSPIKDACDYDTPMRLPARTSHTCHLKITAVFH